MIETIYQLKQQQWQALQQNDWEQVASLESEVNASIQKYLECPKPITESEVKKLQEINEIHLKVAEVAENQRTLQLKEVLNLKKGRHAAKAYQKGY